MSLENVFRYFVAIDGEVERTSNLGGRKGPALRVERNQVLEMTRKRGDFDVVVSDEVDRLWRNVRDHVDIPAKQTRPGGPERTERPNGDAFDVRGP